MSYWLISVPSGGQLGNSKAILSTLQSQVPGDVGVDVLHMPELKVGTLDSLMSLSDDLERVDRYVEGVVHRLEKEIRNIINSDADEHENPAKRESREKQIREMKFIETGATNERMPPTYIAAEQYLKKFQWDQTRYGIKSTLPEIVKDIQDLIQRTDEDLKVKQMDYNQIKSALATAARKKEGNLSSKSLVEVVERHHVISSDRLESVFCAVPKSGVNEFLEKYGMWGKVPANDHPKKSRDRFILHEIEELEKDVPDYEKRRAVLIERQLDMQVNGVVPESADLVVEDTEYALYRVVIFKSARNSFEQDCNAKSTSRIIVRDFSYNENQAADEHNEVSKLNADESTAKGLLKRWATTGFSEAYRAWIHLKTIRGFVESVLRYGLPGGGQPPKNAYMLIKPGRHEDKVRKVLNTLYDALGSGMAGKNEDTASAAFYPYVDIEIKYTGDADV